MLHAVKSHRRRIWLQILLVAIPVVVLVATGWYTYRWYMHGDELPVDIPVFVTADPDVDESEVTQELVTTHVVDTYAPRYLSIPALGIQNTRVFGVGVDKNGALMAPANISDVAWYSKSATPGSGGVVLVDGHNGGITRNGVFSRLHTLTQGSIIEIERGDGEKFRYEVRENQSMHIDEVNSTGMSMMLTTAEEGREALNIITCDGKWVPRLGQFDRRIMLRAVLLA